MKNYLKWVEFKKTTMEQLRKLIFALMLSDFRGLDGYYINDLWDYHFIYSEEHETVISTYKFYLDENQPLLFGIQKLSKERIDLLYQMHSDGELNIPYIEKIGILDEAECIIQYPDVAGNYTIDEVVEYLTKLKDKNTLQLFTEGWEKICKDEGFLI